LKGTKLPLPFDKAWLAVYCGGVEAITIISEEVSVDILAQSYRLVDNSVEHRREIPRRRIDDLQDFGGRSLLRQGLARLGQEPRVLHRDHCL
jgi:hypothetical protein